MEIRDLINIVIKRLWLIIALPFITGVVAVYVNFMVFVPVYRASTSLLITGLSSGSADAAASNLRFEDIIAGQSLISEYSEIIRSKRVISAVLKDLNDSTIADADLKDMISINAVNDTRIIAISVVHPEPAAAARIADSVAKAFSEEIAELYKIENINIIDKAEIPKDPIAPTKKKNIAMSGMAALIAAVSIAFLIEFLDNTIKTSDDVEKHLGLNVIGSIPVNTTSRGRKK